MSSKEFYKAECPFCGQHIEVPMGYTEWVKCPNESCTKSFPPDAKKRGEILAPIISQSQGVTGARLTTCPDCSREVSIRADTCPGCGAPLRATPLKTTNFQPSLHANHLGTVYKKEVLKEIETARSGRTLVLVGSLMMIFSIGGCVSGSDIGTGIGCFLFLGGIGVFVAGRLSQN